MAMPIDPRSTVAPLREALTKIQSPSKADTGGGNFVDALKGAVESTVQRNVESNQAAEKLSKGGELDLHDTLLAMEKGDVSLKFMVSVRNKVLDAYREIMRMGG